MNKNTTRLMQFLVMLAIAASLSGCGKTEKSAKNSPMTPETIAAQEKRDTFIKKLINRGIFQKVDAPGSLPHLWVGKRFYSLNYDDKNLFVGVVYAYYSTMKSSYNAVVLYDSKTGKQIGTYAPVYGGLDLD